MAYWKETNIEDQARKFRQLLGLDHQDRLDMMTVITKAKQSGLIQNYRRVPDTEMSEDDEASYDPQTRIMRIRESTFRSMMRGEARARFTIAHEFGHAVLGHEVERHRDPTRLHPALRRLRRDEWQANRFAGAFLAPAHRVNHQNISVAELQSQFGLGYSAALIRKEELDKIFRKKNGIPRSLPGEVVDFLREARERGHQVTSIPND